MSQKPTNSPEGGDVVLLVHGSMDRASSFNRVMRHLPECHVVAYDRRGYAGSTSVTPAADLATQIDDLFEVLGGRRAVGVGHSFGGTLLLAAAARQPDLLDTLVVYEAPQPWRDDWPVASAGGEARISGGDPADVAEAFMRRLVGDRVWDRLPASTRAQRRLEGEALRAEMLALAEGPAFDPAHIRVPVIVGRGEHGRPHQRQGAALLAAELPAGELVDVAGAEHGVHLSHPGELARLVRLALERRHNAPSSS